MYVLAYIQHPTLVGKWLAPLQVVVGAGFESRQVLAPGLEESWVVDTFNGANIQTGPRETGIVGDMLVGA